jgi:hypothetical protein
MHDLLPLALALLVSAAIIVIGLFYIASPAHITGGFGLPAPAFDPITRAWLRTKGVRDIAAGLVVLVLLLTADHRTVGVVVLVLASIPLGDMLNVIASGGRKSTALSVHGFTCLVMLFTGLLFLHAF